MALTPHSPTDKDSNEMHSQRSPGIDSNANSISAECFLYDTNTKPTCIESLFGEPYHVKDKYASHRVSLRFVLTLSAVYLVEGCTDWLLIATRYYGNSTWDIGPSQMQKLRSIIFLPWNIKIIYGLTIDCVSLCGYKRKSYMLLFSLLAAASMLVAIVWAPYFYVQLICLTLNQLAVSFCDVIADALTVERTEFKSHSVATRLQVLAWGSRYIASIVGIIVSTRIELSNKPEDMLKVYWLYFFIVLSMAACSILLPEQRKHKRKKSDTMLNEKQIDLTDSMIMNQTQSYSVKQILFLTFETLCRKAIFYPVLFVFILAATPRSDEAMDYFLMYKLGFSSVYIGYLSIATGVAFFISCSIITYQARGSNHSFSLRKVSFVWTLIATVLPFMTLILVFGWNKKLGIPDIFFMAGDKVFVYVALDMLSMSINILFARICPPGIEGVFMTVLTSIANIGSTISTQISAAMISGLGIACEEDPNNTDSEICNFKYLWLLIVITNVTTLIPLIYIKKIPDETELKRIGDELKEAATLDHKKSDRSRMIKVYLVVMDYIVPFVKKKMCCCCKKDKTATELQLELTSNANHTLSKSHMTEQNQYSEIEMR